MYVIRFYVPALGAIALPGAWLLVQLGTWLTACAPRRAPLALTSTALVVAMPGLGMRSEPVSGSVAVRPAAPC